ncbi:MAG: hypothetical protein A2091_07505 [Desulfuromonadales bacterium GWD2_61_12]|nr:MAG: hypothetical protein A2005_09575 [Desulfuromonadales bacterium GWC2_61_20]OGR36624.1 MAG: hypothetical protein A2091_07505 [Desulfuromonadales bacterium GWD2_61_12]
MRAFAPPLFVLLALLLTPVAPPSATAAGGGGSFPVQRVDSDLDRANQAIAAKNYDRAIAYLNAVVARDDRNAEAHNLLGYAERMRGNLAAAFPHYERALALDPKHRGAHEYIGEAYLQGGNLAKAEEHLARLDKLCRFSCAEYRDLKRAVADYRAQHPQ